MLINWETSLKGKRVQLVPYRREHVLTYHGWMQDPWIREMTASEPLTLDEEYAMQLSWKEDPKKCTFIVLALEEDENDHEAAGGDKESKGKDKGTTSEPAAAETEAPTVTPPSPPPPPPATATTTTAAAMAGDVNLFFNDYDDPGMCEVEVMIAEERFRRRGLAREAVLMLMRYALDHLGATTFYCKIGDANAASLALFETLGYSKHAYVEAFKETELRFAVAAAEGTEGAVATLRSQTDHVQTVPCPDPAAAEEERR